MIGIDTNVLVRYIAQDDLKQAARASKLIESECTVDDPGFIGLITLVELVWVSESCYGASKKDISTIITRLLSAKQLIVQDAEVVRKALNKFESVNADFSDCLVGLIADFAGCKTTFTFDKAAAKAGMTLLN